MAVTYSNNFNNIIDKLMEIIKVEVPVPVVKATTKDPMLRANQSIRIIPNGSTLVTYASHMEQREYNMTLSDSNSTRAFDLRMDEMELDVDVDEEGYFVVEYSFSCQHIGNQA